MKLYILILLTVCLSACSAPSPTKQYHPTMHEIYHEYGYKDFAEIYLPAPPVEGTGDYGWKPVGERGD